MRVLLEKLKWRSRRSLLELDLFFSNYINSGKFENMSSHELSLYEELLELEDGYLLSLLQGKDRLDDDNLQQVIEQIKSCRNFTV